ncbi:MAG: flagellar basal body rod C-terminal domain-containing protein [Syntrophomonadaceae bacterium]
MEQSNVNAVEEMVTLISTVRAYEALQKVVQAEDELNQVAIDEVGKVI